jgi:Tfp pilus assembly protein PilO
MLANRTSRWSIGAALLCLVLLAASWFLLISPRRADADAIRVQVTSADSQAAQLETQIAQLKIDYAGLKDQKAKLKAIQRLLPPGADIPTFVRDLQSMSTTTGVSLDSIAPGAPAVVSASGTASAATATAGAGTLVGLPMTIVVTGEYFEAALFVKTLQTKLKRSFLITALTAAPAAVVDAGATATAAPTATATSSATPTPTPVVTSTAAAGLDRITLTLTGSAFVLLDGTVTLDDVAADAKAAALAAKKGGTVATPTTASTAAGSAS